VTTARFPLATAAACWTRAQARSTRCVEDLPAFPVRRRVARGKHVEVKLRVGRAADVAEVPLLEERVISHGGRGWRAAGSRPWRRLAQDRSRGRLAMPSRSRRRASRSPGPCRAARADCREAGLVRDALPSVSPWRIRKMDTRFYRRIGAERLRSRDRGGAQRCPPPHSPGRPGRRRCAGRGFGAVTRTATSLSDIFTGVRM